MKQFVKALPKEAECFKYLCDQFPGLSEAKLKEGVFVGPDSRKMMKDENSETKMETNESKAWKSFKLVITIARVDEAVIFHIDQQTEGLKKIGSNDGVGYRLYYEWPPEHSSKV
ncbi:hypothetical protein AVEN_139450-1 [Araneus ventricosus]|uniref:Uncharacterized protein n=1 Tax=Araneus ventricosus TaxID=182803 RepID=A0A4Y2IYR2_ARAVE|nr:hypothetical protein AVEN_139450-1 [Araneus ventricosus]